MGRRARAYERLDVDERRRRLLAKAADLFTRHAYDELSMSAIAREAGISKALLYHYFPSKQALFGATLREKAAELAERTAPDPALPPERAIERSLEGFLSWVEENAGAYAKLVRSYGVAEVREVVDDVREATAQVIVAGLLPDGATGAQRGAARAWLWFLDGLILDWLERRDVTRADVHRVALAALRGALAAP